jgi:hypothetical protein
MESSTLSVRGPLPGIFPLICGPDVAANSSSARRRCCASSGWTRYAVVPSQIHLPSRARILEAGIRALHGVLEIGVLRPWLRSGQSPMFETVVLNNQSTSQRNPENVFEQNKLDMSKWHMLTGQLALFVVLNSSWGQSNGLISSETTVVMTLLDRTETYHIKYERVVLVFV